MEYLATVVFERTPAGSVAIKTAGDAMPRPLRTLLLAIDGRLPVSQYVSLLTALAPLSDKFAQLELMGFTRRRIAAADAGTETPSPLLSAPAVSISSRQAQQVTEPELRNFASLLPIQPSMLPDAAPNTSTLDVQLKAFAQSNANHGFNDLTDISGSLARPQQITSPQADASQLRRPVLADLLKNMQAYLSHAAGMEGLPVALMLEEITSLAQLRRELPSYAALVASYGGEPAAHISTLGSLLDAAEG